MADSPVTPAPVPDWQRILDAVNDCVWSATIAADGRWMYRYVSPAIERIAGRPASWFLPGRERWLEAIHHDDQPRVDASDRALPFALRSSRDAEYCYRFVRPDGTIRWVRDVVRVGESHPIRLDGVIADITEQRVAELALRAGEDRLRRIIDTNPDAIILVDTEKRITLANPSAARLFGKPRRELVGMRWDQLGVEQEAIDTDKSVIRGQQYTVIRPDGTRARALMTMATLKGIDGELAGFVAVFDDVTALATATESLARSEARSRLLLEQLPAVVWSVDCDLRFTSSQGRGLRELNLLPDQVVGLTLFEYLQTDDPNHTIIAACRKALSGEEGYFDTEHRGRNFATYLEPLRDHDGTVVGAVAVSLDVTRVRDLETRLRSAGRLQALGQLAGGAAHDINNLLTALHGHLDRARQAVTHDAAVIESIDVATQAAERAAEIARQLLGVSRRGGIGNDVADLNAVVREVIALLGPAFHGDIHATTTFAPGPLLVGVEPGEVHQVLINLCVNACDAMPAGGRLSVTTDLLPELNMARVIVADTGIGMTPEVKARIFEPLFTTKEPNRGTGLGLPSVRTIVRRAGGRIECDSTPGQGTRFVVDLPIATAVQVASMPATPTSGRTILIADDEPTIRSLVRQALEESGYRVIEAADGFEAVEQAAKFDGLIDLAILDLTMPRLGGRDAFRQLRRQLPRLPVLFATGVLDASTDEMRADEGVVGMLEKPYRLAELLSAVRGALKT